jgi:hypothetical protein
VAYTQTVWQEDTGSKKDTEGMHVGVGLEGMRVCDPFKRWVNGPPCTDNVKRKVPSNDRCAACVRKWKRGTPILRTIDMGVSVCV